jgi:signal peptidase I
MFNKTSNGMKSNFWKELGKLIIISIFIVVPFRLYIAQPFVVDGASMDPTFGTGDYLIVDEITYHFKTPERGSVLIFKYPRDPRKSFIKRVIGLPGETVTIEHGAVSVDGVLLNEPYVKLPKDDTGSYPLGPGEYFVLGDNRLASYDSRGWGSVPEKNIIGRPLIRLFPPMLFPGDSSKRYIP